MVPEAHDSLSGSPVPGEGELSDLCGIALGIAREAAALAARRRTEGVRIAATKSTLTDIVTEADREVEAFIRECIQRERPGDGFLGEESGEVKGETGFSWIVDPIDGTVNYLYGIPYSAVSIAVAATPPDREPEGREAVAGAVVNIFTGEAFTAFLGGGARCNGVPISAADADQLGQALAITGFSYDPQLRAEHARACAAIVGSIRDVRRMGAAALDLCSIAAGRADLYFERDIKLWDYAAGALIVREAGAQFGGLAGEPVCGGMVLAGSARIRAAFEPVLLGAMEEARGLA